MINDMIKRLRKAADVLETLLENNPSDNYEAAKAIRTRIKGNLTIPSIYKPANPDQELERLVRLKKEAFSKVLNKKKHWTQTIAGKKKMSALQKKAWAKRR